MFDLRYHVASLAAVFLALIIGIVVGVGISGKGFVSDSERSLFNERIADLKSQPRLGDEARHRPRRGRSAPRRLRPGRLPGADGRPALGLEGRPRLRRAGRRPGPLARGADARRRRAALRRCACAALKLPIDLPDAAAGARRAARARGARDPDDGSATSAAGSAASSSLGGDSPLWQALSADPRRGAGGQRRAAGRRRRRRPQRGAPERRRPPASSPASTPGSAPPGVPAVGRRGDEADGDAAVDAFAKQKLSTVDDLDTQAGRLALALLLARRRRPGQYGVKKTARDGVLPPIPAPSRGG